MSSLVSMMSALGGVARMSATVMKTVSQIGSGVQNIGQFFADAFNKAGKAIHDVYKKLAGWYDEYIKPKFDWLSDKASSIINLFLKMGDKISTVWNDIINKISDIYNNRIRPLFDFNLFSTLEGYFENFKALFDFDLFATMRGYFDNFKNDVESGIEKLESRIKDSIIYKVGSGVANFAGDARDAVSDVASDAVGATKQQLGINVNVTGLAGDLADAISKTIEKEVERKVSFRGR